MIDWEKVSGDAIKNCWLHTGILPKTFIENMAIDSKNAFIVYDDGISFEIRKEDIQTPVKEKEENGGILDNYNDITALTLIHVGNDEVDDI
ncbi:hypothetical protein INT46_002500 [Mucor plumbeus]|uniref:Uncharacterized protein n=1 Tax=Mucor plumbeus TaxID=97098 RepID=A0A8H7QCZ2_9FUNG|nr:hypothetical protein INT46_002500 [Mucor plumbeus]